MESTAPEGGSTLETLSQYEKTVRDRMIPARRQVASLGAAVALGLCLSNLAIEASPAGVAVISALLSIFVQCLLSLALVVSTLRLYLDSAAGHHRSVTEVVSYAWGRFPSFLWLHVILVAVSIVFALPIVLVFGVGVVVNARSSGLSSLDDLAGLSPEAAAATPGVAGLVFLWLGLFLVAGLVATWLGLRLLLTVYIWENEKIHGLSLIRRTWALTKGRILSLLWMVVRVHFQPRVFLPLIFAVWAILSNAKVNPVGAIGLMEGVSGWNPISWLVMVVGQVLMYAVVSPEVWRWTTARYLTYLEDERRSS